MADKCACMFFESGPNIMSGLAADCNTLVSKYNVDVNEERAIDQVFHFTDDDDLRAAFVDNVQILSLCYAIASRLVHVALLHVLALRG